MLAVSKFLPLVTELGKYLKMAIDHYADLRTAGKEAGPEIVALFIRAKLESWDPKVGDAKLLDSDTKDAAARFLAGVAVNFSK